MPLLPDAVDRDETMSRPPEPDCPRWTVERGALAKMRHVGKGELSRRAVVHAKYGCPLCAGFEIPPFTSREPEEPKR